MGAELLKRVDVVQMEADNAVARTSSRVAHPCTADAAPLRYTHIRRRKRRTPDYLVRESKLGLGRTGRQQAWAQR